MASDNQILVEIVLDDGSIQKGFARIKDTAQKTGSEVKSSWKDSLSPKSLTDFAAGFYLIKEAASIAGKVFNEAFDLIKAGEQIKALNVQFELLAQNAGIVGGELISGLEQAANGLVDTEELLHGANIALVQFGNDAKRLPEILEQSKKAAVLMGTDTVSAYENISNAIATGNMKAIKQVTGVIDLDKAYKEYAKTIGITVEQLDEQQKISARLNIVLETMKTKLENIDPELNKATTSWKRFTVSVGEAYDSIATVTSRALGGTFSSALDVAGGVIKGTGIALDASLGTGAAKAKAQIAQLTEQIKYLEDSLKTPTMNAQNWQARIDAENTLPGLREQLRLTQLQLEGFNGTVEDSLSGRAASKAGVDDVIKLIQQRKEAVIKANQEALKSNNDFNAQMLQLNSQELQAKVEAAKSIDDQESRKIELAKLAGERMVQLSEERELALSQLREKYNKPEDIEKLEAARVAIIEAYGAKEVELKTKIGDEIAEKNKINYDLTSTLTSGMVNVTSVAMAKLALALRGADNGWENLNNAIVSALGDVVTSIGQAILAIGIAMLKLDVALKTFTPWEAIAAGAGLMLLGNMMKASVGDSLSSAASGGGGGVAAEPTSLPTNEVTTTQERVPQSSLVVNVNGNILGDEASGAMLVDYINKAFDEKGVSIRSGAIA